GASVSEYEALAKNVIRRTLHIQPKENVIVETWNHGLPIATEVVYQVRAAGARPMLLFEDEDTYWKSVTTLPESKLGQVGSHEWKNRTQHGERDAGHVRIRRESRGDRGWDRHQRGARRGREHG